MSSIVIAGDTSGTCTLQANAIAGTTTLTLPTTSGALVVGASAGISIPNPGTSANVLTSNGSAWVSQAPSAASSISNGTSNVAVNSSGGTVSIATNGSTAMTVDTSQNVGIGGAPSYKLDVRGTIGTNNNITIEDTSNVYGFVVGRGFITSNGAGGFGGLSFKTYNGGFTTQVDIDGNGVFKFNSGYGSAATAYGCRAWVNFVGSSGSIRGSGSVSSITRNGTGDYTVNFSITFPDTNYCTQLTGMRDSANNGSLNTTVRGDPTYSNSVTTTTIRILAENDSGTRVDPTYYGVAVFR